MFNVETKTLSRSSHDLRVVISSNKHIKPPKYTLQLLDPSHAHQQQVHVRKAACAHDKGGMVVEQVDEP